MQFVNFVFNLLLFGARQARLVSKNLAEELFKF